MSFSKYTTQKKKINCTQTNIYLNFRPFKNRLFTFSKNTDRIQDI